MNKQLILDSDKSFIGAWYLEDTSLCDDMIHYFENSDSKYAGIILKDGELVVNKNEKDSVDIVMKPAEQITNRYVAELQKILELYKIKFSRSEAVGLFGIESINIQKYNSAGGYKFWHTERSDGTLPSVYRHLVFMTYLNNVTDQGETEFLYQKLKVTPEKGLTLIWPADWTHTHRGIPSKNQIKYIATGWYTFLINENIKPNAQ